MLGDLDLLELERAHRLDEQDHAGDDRGGAVGVQADDARGAPASSISARRASSSSTVASRSG